MFEPVIIIIIFYSTFYFFIFWMFSSQFFYLFISKSILYFLTYSFVFYSTQFLLFILLYFLVFFSNKKIISQFIIITQFCRFFGIGGGGFINEYALHDNYDIRYSFIYFQLLNNSPRLYQLKLATGIRKLSNFKVNTKRQMKRGVSVCLPTNALMILFF